MSFVDYNKMNDEDLISLYKKNKDKNDIPIFLCEKYKGMVRDEAKMLFLIGGDADDLIQEGMIGLLFAINDYEEGKGASFLTFARLCVRRKMYNAIEAASRKKHSPLNSYVSLSKEEGGTEDIIDSSYGTYDNDPETNIIKKENEKDLYYRLRDVLSKLENEVLGLLLQGLDYKEIAEKLGKTDKSVDNAIQRIRNKAKAL